MLLVLTEPCPSEKFSQYRNRDTARYLAMLCDARDHASPSQHASATRVKRYTCQSWAPKVRERCGWAAGKRLGYL